MDGVLIDSEPLWKIAMEKVFCSLGSNLSKKDFEKTVGLRIDEVIRFWNVQENWNLESEELVEKQIIDELVVLINERGKPINGVVELLNFLKKSKIKIGLATSSSFVLIETVLNKLELKPYFNATHSAEHEDFGKPHPSVYIKTASQLGVLPEECLVVEDSLNGIISGLSARMKVVCIPEKTHLKNPRLTVADFYFHSMPELLKELNRTSSLKE